MKPVYHMPKLVDVLRTPVYPHAREYNPPHMRMIADFFLDILFPRLCLLCGKTEVLLCGECMEKLPPADTLSIPDAFALYKYADTGVKKILWHFKYRGGRSCAVIFAQRIYQKIAEERIAPASTNVEASLPTGEKKTKKKKTLVGPHPNTPPR